MSEVAHALPVLRRPEAARVVSLCHEQGGPLQTDRSAP